MLKDTILLPDSIHELMWPARYMFHKCSPKIANRNIADSSELQYNYVSAFNSFQVNLNPKLDVTNGKRKNSLLDPLKLTDKK